jgi:hypothetical protein
MQIRETTFPLYIPCKKRYKFLFYYEGEFIAFIKQNLVVVLHVCRKLSRVSWKDIFHS